MVDHDERRGRRPRRGRSRGSASLEDKWFGRAARDPTLGRGSSDRRARQLCRQVQEQLELVFRELEDPVLEGVTLLGVEQEAGGRTLRVLLLVPSGRESGEVHAHLDGLRGRLRGEIAAAIHRKRTPQLGFVLIPGDALRAPDSEADDDA